MRGSPSAPPEVAAVFTSYPVLAQPALSRVRDLIFLTAAGNSMVGILTETLKWGEPSYLTEKSKSGTTIRLCWKPSAPEFGGLYFNCQTSLIDTMRNLYSEAFTFQGNRALLFSLESPFDKGALQHCIEMALTYHVNKKRVL